MFKNTINGIKAYGNSLKIIRELGLWKYFGIPIFISLLTGILIGVLTWVFSDDLGSWIARIWAWEWGAETFRSISTIISALAIITFGLIVYKHFVLALSAPFMGLVSEKIEAHRIGEDPELSNTFNWGLIWRGVRINVRNLMMELLLTIPILFIGFIPIIGFISTPLLFLVQAYYAGFGNMDYTLERHLSYRQSVQFVGNHKGIALGNGMVFMLILLVPILGIILVLPFSVTAASSETINVVLNSKSKNK
jgi:CysZ protein